MDKKGCIDVDRGDTRDKHKGLSAILGITFILCILSFTISGSTGMIRYTARIVISGSMEPTIPVYTLNIIEKCDISDIVKGDIILYNYKADIIHRVVEVENGGAEVILITQGDANVSRDEIGVNSDMFIGKVIKTFHWTQHIFKPLKVMNRETIQVLIFICIIGIYIVKVIAEKYFKIYIIYRRYMTESKHISTGSIYEVLGYKKRLWEKAEKEHLNNRTWKEKTTYDDE